MTRPAMTPNTPATTPIDAYARIPPTIPFNTRSLSTIEAVANDLHHGQVATGLRRVPPRPDGPPPRISSYPLYYFLGILDIDNPKTLWFTLILYRGPAS